MPLSRRHKKTKRLKKRFNKKLQKTKRLNKRGGGNKSVINLPTIQEVDENENDEINNPSSPRTPRKKPVYDYGAAEEEEVYENDLFTIFIDYDVIINLYEDNKQNINHITNFLNQMRHIDVDVVIYDKVFGKYINNYEKIQTGTIEYSINSYIRNVKSSITQRAFLDIMIEFFKYNPFNNSERSFFITDNENIHLEVQKYVDSDESKLSGLTVLKATKNNYIEHIIMIIEYLQVKYQNNKEKTKYLKGCLEHWNYYLSN